METNTQTTTNNTRKSIGLFTGGFLLGFAKGTSTWLKAAALGISVVEEVGIKVVDVAVKATGLDKQQDIANIRQGAGEARELLDGIEDIMINEIREIKNTRFKKMEDF